MNARLEWTAAVSDVIGVEALKEVCRTANKYRCQQCGGQGNATKERTSIIVVAGDRTKPPLVNLAHYRCAAPQVVHVEWSPGVVGPGDEDVVSVPVVLPLPDGELAGLLIDRHDQVAVIHKASGARQDPWLQFLLGNGWERVFDSGQEFPLVNTCVIELHGGGRVVGTDPQRTVIVEPLPDLAPEWMTPALARGYVRVYAGELRLDEASSYPAALAAAIGAGRVAGAHVPLGRSPKNR